jgi:hypothetical protein
VLRLGRKDKVNIFEYGQCLKVRVRVSVREKVRVSVRVRKER